MLWLLTCSICCLQWIQYYVVGEFTVKRERDGDIIVPSECVHCGKYGAVCDGPNYAGICSVKNRCRKCKCHTSAKLFYQNSVTRHCVKDGKDDLNNLKDKCQFYLPQRSHEQVHQPWIELDKRKANPVQLGFLKHISVLLYPPRYQCKVTTKQYWNLIQWKKLDEKFFIAVNKKKHVLNLTVSKTSNLDGYLIKLGIECEKNGSKNGKEENASSCTMFKFLGKRTYDVSIPDTTVTTQRKLKTSTSFKSTTTLTPRTTQVTGIPIPPPTNARTLIIIIIGVGATLVLVLCGIIVWCFFWRRKGHSNNNNNRNSDGNHALLDDPNYQNPDELPGRRATSVNGSASNLTYLQPIDANIAFNGVRKRPHDPGYDYPSVNLNTLSQKSSSTHDDDSRPIYAEVSDIIVPSSRNSTASTHGPHSVISEPGYQPPVGVPEFRGDAVARGKYSSLGNVGQEGYQTLLNQPGKPPTPQYAEVVPECEQDHSI